LPSGENAKLVIFGSPKSGRTTLGLSICVPLSKGEPALKKLPSLRPLKIAYGNPEQSGSDLAEQIMRMEVMYGLPSAEMFHLLPLCGINQDGDMFRIKLNRPEHNETLLEQLIKGKFDLFFLDSINFGIDDNNDTEQVNAVIGFLSDVVDKAHCALIITDHTKESGEKLKPWERPSPLGKLGNELSRWCGSLLFYTDVTDSLSDYYGKLAGDVRSGIGKVEYYVGYTGITDSVQIVPISSVPMVEGIEARTTRKSARVKEFQQLVVFAEGLGYNRAKMAKALEVSEMSVSNWFRGEKEPGDENWLGIQLIRERLEKTGGL
jgi:DNA-binding transcriptional regulator YiaG